MLNKKEENKRLKIKECCFNLLKNKIWVRLLNNKKKKSYRKIKII